MDWYFSHVNGKIWWQLLGLIFAFPWQHDCLGQGYNNLQSYWIGDDDKRFLQSCWKDAECYDTGWISGVLLYQDAEILPPMWYKWILNTLHGTQFDTSVYPLWGRIGNLYMYQEAIYNTNTSSSHHIWSQNWTSYQHSVELNVFLFTKSHLK